MAFCRDNSTISSTLGLSLCGVCGYMMDKNMKRMNQSNIPRIRRHVKVPAKLVGLIIGKGGHRMREIERLSNTKIKFAKQSHGLVVSCTIRGTYDECLEAEEMMHAIISKQRDTTIEIIYVPDYCIDRLFYYNQEHIDSIARGTDMHIEVDVDAINGLDEEFVKVTIKGQRSQVHHFKQLIAVVIQEIQEMLADLATTLPPLNPQCIATEALLESSTASLVYVTAVVNPFRFWVQIVGPNAQKLDQLIDEMTEFYAQKGNRNSHRSYALFPGDFIAVPYKYDGRYYRARARAIDHVLKQVTVLFVDYGNTETVPLREIFDLAVKFYVLPFQAIQCALHEIAPVDNKWSQDAIDRFKEHAHVAKWYKLSARVNFYEQRYKLTYVEGLIPVIDLYDVVDGVDVNVADLLVEEGLAVRKPEPGPATSAPPSAFTCSADVDSEDSSDEELPDVEMYGAAHLNIPLRGSDGTEERLRNQFLALRMANPDNPHISPVVGMMEPGCSNFLFGVDEDIIEDIWDF